MLNHRACHISKLLFAACLVWSMSTAALAGSFTPEEGATIVTNPVKVTWTSDTPQQWLRAYVDDVKIYDSYRQKSASGSVQFSVNPSISTLKVIFYEKAAGGQWVGYERQYGVSIANDRVNSLADLPCEPDQVAVADGAGNWNCAAQGLPDVVAITDAMLNRYCMEGEELTRTPGGQIACQYRCPYADQLREIGVTRDSQLSSFFLDDAYECVVLSTRNGLLPTSGELPYQTAIENQAGGLVSLRTEIRNSGGDYLLDITIENSDDQLYCARFMGCDSFDPSAGPLIVPGGE